MDILQKKILFFILQDDKSKNDKNDSAIDKTQVGRANIWGNRVRLKIQYPEWGASHVQDTVNVSSKTHAFKQLVLAVTETYHLEDQFTSIWVKNSKSNKVFAQSCQKPQSIPFGHKKSKPLTTTTFGRFCQDFLQLSKKVFCHPMLQILFEKKIGLTS